MSGQASRTITDVLTDHSGGSVSRRVRRGRWEMLASRFPDLSEMRVLDVGGLADAWLDAPSFPAELVLLNVPRWTERASQQMDALGRSRVRYIAADACDPPESLLNEHFDLVHCNSVIEHVGGHHRRVQLVDTIEAVGDHYWVQTPYRYFPIEPHALFPALQFLPMSVRAQIVKRWPIGHMRQYTRDWAQTSPWRESADEVAGRPLRELRDEYAVLCVQNTELLSKAELRTYFPRATIVDERVGGLTKSIIAVR